MCNVQTNPPVRIKTKTGGFYHDENPEQTIGNMADKCGTVFMSYIDDEGFPVTKAMLKSRVREGIQVFCFIQIPRQTK